MPLPLLRCADTADFVCVDDASVVETNPPAIAPLVVPEGASDEARGELEAAHRQAKIANSMRWIEASSASVGADAVVATLGALDHLTHIRLSDMRQTNAAAWLLEVARLGVRGVKGPGLPADLPTALRVLPLEYVMGLGRAVWGLSTNSVDPTEASAS